MPHSGSHGHRNCERLEVGRSKPRTSEVRNPHSGTTAQDELGNHIICVENADNLMRVLRNNTGSERSVRRAPDSECRNARNAHESESALKESMEARVSRRRATASGTRKDEESSQEKSENRAGCHCDRIDFEGCLRYCGRCGGC